MKRTALLTDRSRLPISRLIRLALADIGAALGLAVPALALHVIHVRRVEPNDRVIRAVLLRLSTS
jgi:hypothetical protein